MDNVSRPVGQLADGVPLPQALSKQAWVIVEGLLLAHRIKNHYEEFLTLHLAFDLPLDRAYLDSLSRCVEMLKAIEQTFEARLEEVLVRVELFCVSLCHKNPPFFFL